MKRRGFSAIEVLLSTLIISGALATVSMGHIQLTKAIINARNTYARTIAENEILTQMVKEIKSADAINTDGLTLKIEAGANVIMYENIGGALYRNGDVTADSEYKFSKNGSFLTIDTENFELTVRCT